MNTQGVQITFKGTSFGDCIAQARALIEGMTGVAETEMTVEAPQRKPGRPKTKVAAAPVAEEPELMASEETETDAVGFDEASEDFATEETEEPKAKTAKAKKYTDKDVNTAAMNHAKTYGRPKTLAILSKKFKVKSILELKPEQYGEVIAALEV